MEIPGYKILRCLGEGGMARVYLAIQQSFEREVALKVMSPSLAQDGSFGERFLREARIVSRLVHPNIVTVYDVGVHNGHHFLSMEYVPGQDLKSCRKSLSLADNLRLVMDVARALHFAGAKGYVHRDVKPENIMLQRGDGRAVLMDFGIARPSDTLSDMTQTGIAIGTPYYMSPEQARGKPVDARSDLYSLGVVLFLLLEGFLPFDGDSAVAVGIKHLSEPIPRLRDVLQPLQVIVNKLLSKNPEHRFQTGQELIAALEKFSASDIEAMASSCQHQQACAREAISLISDESPTLIHAQGQMQPVNNRLAEIDGQAEKLSNISARSSIESSRSRRGVWLLMLLLITASGAYLYRDSLVHRLDHFPFVLQPHVIAVDSKFRAALHRAKAWLGTSATDTEGERKRLADRLTVKPIKSVVTTLVDDMASPESLAPVVVLPAQTLASMVAVGGPGDGLEAVALSAAEVVSKAAADPVVQSFESWLLSRIPDEARAEQLNLWLEEDLARASWMVRRLQRLLAQEPSYERARRGLSLIRDAYIRSLRGAVLRRDEPLVRRHLASAAEAFPNWIHSQAYRQFERELVRLEQLGQLLLAARAAMPQAQQSEAARLQAFGPSFVEQGGAVLLRKLLALDPEYPGGKSLQAEMAAHYWQLASEHYQQQRWQQSQALIVQGLAVDARYPKLLALQRQVALKQQFTKIFERAESLRRAGKLLSPETGNALALYRQLLQLDSNYRPAQQGLRRLEGQLRGRIEDYMAAQDYPRANRVMQQARRAFPQSEVLRKLDLQLGLQLEKVQRLALEASQPEIATLRVFSRPTADLQGRQVGPLRLDRTVYVGFHYNNFQSLTAVLQAKLYDGARSLQLAQVSVVIRGRDGMQFFSFQRPVQGFIEGGYHIDLLLQGDRLASTSFQVMAAQPVAL